MTYQLRPAWAYAVTALMMITYACDATAKEPAKPKPGTVVQAGTKPRAVPLPRPRPKAVVPFVGPTAPAETKSGAPLPRSAALTPPSRAAMPLAMTPTASTPPADAATIKQAIELMRKNKIAQAAETEKSVSDPLARKLIEWVILRGTDDDFDFNRYSAFISANPGWPSLSMFRRKAEAALWQDRGDDQTVRAFFTSTKPITAKGRLAFARALLAQGDRAGAQHYAREAWRQDAMSRDLEKQALDIFGPLLTNSDHKARMDIRFYAEDVDAGMRAAQRLGGMQVAIAKARAAVINKAGNAGKLLDAVASDARGDAGYIFSRVQWLRRADKIPDAARWMLAAPRDPLVIHNTDEWWIERRLVARKLLDNGDPRSAYRIARDAAPPVKGNYRVDHVFTAGWIALRHLNDPATALTHFSSIARITSHPTGLARGAYWQGRAAEALNRPDEVRAHYERAARYSTAYYGQLARARLGPGHITLRPAPELTPQTRDALARLELVRAVEILYAIDERDLIIPIVADIAERADADTLAMFAGIAARRQDARALLVIGKGALARDLPFDRHAYPIEGLPRYREIGPAVEPQVAYSIARQESGFNPRAVSSANAYGLMQVTAPAGKYVAKKFNIAFNQKRLLDDPVYNVQIGAAELGDLIESYRGSYILAFAAYNAGRTRVRDWIERYGDPREPKVDPVDWVERIPFSETRNYVQRVLENLQVYRLRFGGSSRLMIEADLRRGAQTN